MIRKVLLIDNVDSFTFNSWKLSSGSAAPPA